MEMKSMKMDPKKMKETMEAAETDRPEYSYGLKLNLDHETMKKLGMKMPEIGKEMMLHAKVMVTDIHESKSESSEYRSLGLQITDMAIEEEKKSLEKRLYPEQE